MYSFCDRISTEWHHASHTWETGRKPTSPSRSTGLSRQAYVCKAGAFAVRKGSNCLPAQERSWRSRRDLLHGPVLKPDTGAGLLSLRLSRRLKAKGPIITIAAGGGAFLFSAQFVQPGHFFMETTVGTARGRDGGLESAAGDAVPRLRRPSDLTPHGRPPLGLHEPPPALPEIPGMSS